MAIHTQRGPFLNYTILLAAFAFVLIFSSSTPVHARILRERNVVARSKNFINNPVTPRDSRAAHDRDGLGELLTNARRLALGLPLKKPYLQRSGENIFLTFCLFHVSTVV